MAVRLGNILYWLGIVLAAIALLEASLVLFGSSPSGSNSGVLIGVVVCSVGWAARYILRGPSQLRGFRLGDSAPAAIRRKRGLEHGLGIGFRVGYNERGGDVGHGHEI